MTEVEEQEEKLEPRGSQTLYVLLIFMPWFFAGLLRWIFSSASGSEVLDMFCRNVLPIDVLPRNVLPADAVNPIFAYPTNAVNSIFSYPRWLFFIHLGVCMFAASGLLVASRISRNAVSNLALVANVLLLSMAFVNLGLERRWFTL